MNLYKFTGYGLQSLSNVKPYLYGTKARAVAEVLSKPIF